MSTQVVDAFDATRHPEVVDGHLAPDEMFREFVQGFTAGISRDKRVSLPLSLLWTPLKHDRALLCFGGQLRALLAMVDDCVNETPCRVPR